MKVIVFGVGQYLERVEYACLLHGFRVVAYLDNDPGKQGGSRNGAPILSPREIGSLDYDRVITSSVASNEAMRQQLLGLGIAEESILAFSPAGNSWPQNGRYLVHHRHSVLMDSQTLQTSPQTFEIGGVFSEEIAPPVSPQGHAALVERLMSALHAAENAIKTCPPAYRAGENWFNVLRHPRPEYYEARRTGDDGKIATLLANFYRNEMSSGMLGGREGYEAYLAHPDMSDGIRRNFNVWAYSLGKAPVEELASPPIGNPYGHLIDGHIIHPNTFLNSYRGHLARKLMEGIDRPVIAEIGGGFGGFGFYVKKHLPGSCYINFDLPENLLVSSYYLSLAYPDLDIHLYTGDEDLASLIQTRDIVLLPNFSLPQLPADSVDLFVNTISLAEMSYPTICEYLQQIDRTGRKFFYHENLIENGSGYTYYPIDTFPSLPRFKEISRQPSRWPFFSSTSPFHCHVEQLFMRTN